MDLTQNTISYADSCFNRVSQSMEASDFIIPDILPDVKEIVGAFGQLSIADLNQQADRILVSGTVAVSVFYRGEPSGDLRQVNTTIHFAHIEDNMQQQELIPFVQGSVVLVTASVVNSRKLNVQTQLQFIVSCFAMHTQELTSGISDPSVQQLTETVSWEHVFAVQKAAFTILDDLEIDQTGTFQLTHATCDLNVTECRAMQGKVMLKGTAAVRIVYAAPAALPEERQHSIPFTQVIDLPAATATDPSSALLTPLDLICRLEDSGQLSVTINAGALVLLHRNDTVETIKDYFIPGYHCTAQTQTVTLRGMRKPEIKKMDITSILHLPQPAAKLLTAFASCCVMDHTDENQLLLTLWYFDEASQLQCITKKEQFTLDVGMLQSIYTVTTLQDRSGDEVTLKTIIQLSQAQEQILSAVHLSDLQVEPNETSKSDIAMILQYIHADCSLWSVAKLHGVSLDALRQANGLESSVQSVGSGKLLIPVET